MSLRNSLFVSAASTLGAILLTARAVAGEVSLDPSGAATNRPAISASLRSGETVGDHQVQRVFLHLGTNEIAFTVPTGFCTDASDPQKIVLSDNASGCFITVRVSQAAVPEGASPEDFFKGEALSRFPGGKVTDESSDFAAGHSGSAFSLEWTSSSGTEESARIAFIPCAAGVLEFSALARTPSFRDARLYLSILMTSVRSNETGKLVIVPLPDFS